MLFTNSHPIRDFIYENIKSNNLYRIYNTLFQRLIYLPYFQLKRLQQHMIQKHKNDIKTVHY